MNDEYKNPFSEPFTQDKWLHEVVRLREELELLKASIETIRETAHECITYVGRANWAERERDAHSKLDDAVDEVLEGKE